MYENYRIKILRAENALGLELAINEWLKENSPKIDGIKAIDVRGPGDLEPFCNAIIVYMVVEDGRSY